MSFINKETSRISQPLRELSASELIEISGGKPKEPVCTTTVSSTTKGGTTTTTVTTVCK